MGRLSVGGCRVRHAVDDRFLVNGGLTLAPSTLPGFEARGTPHLETAVCGGGCERRRRRTRPAGFSPPEPQTRWRWWKERCIVLLSPAGSGSPVQMKSPLLILRRREQGTCARAKQGPTSQEGQAACAGSASDDRVPKRRAIICTGQKGVCLDRGLDPHRDGVGVNLHSPQFALGCQLAS